MIEVNAIDTVPGEAEVLRLLTSYLANRLFTPRQRKSMQIFVDLTHEAVRVPVSRDMFVPRKAGLRTIAPASFEMTVSTVAGIRDAGQVIAHEMVHISQVMNDRLAFSRGARKINRQKVKVELARWMGGKTVIIDQLEWHHRPWEIEACRWQGELVDEFLALANGQQPVQQEKKASKKHLALYVAALPVPQMVRSNAEPHLELSSAPPVVTTLDRTQPAQIAASTEAANTVDPAVNGAARIADNAASIDSLLAAPDIAAVQGASDDPVTSGSEEGVISMATLEAVFGTADAIPADAAPADAAPADASSGDQQDLGAKDTDLPLMSDVPLADMPISAPQVNGVDAEHDMNDAVGADAMPCADHIADTSDMNGADMNGADMNGADMNGTDMNGSDMNGYHADSPILAPDGVLQVVVPGLQAPRVLHPDALAAKRHELGQRGLLIGLS